MLTQPKVVKVWSQSGVNLSLAMEGIFRERPKVGTGTAEIEIDAKVGTEIGIGIESESEGPGCNNHRRRRDSLLPGQLKLQ